MIGSYGSVQDRPSPRAIHSHSVLHSRHHIQLNLTNSRLWTLKVNQYKYELFAFLFTLSFDYGMLHLNLDQVALSSSEWATFFTSFSFSTYP